MSTDAIPEDAEQLPPSAVPTPLVVPSMGDDSDPDLANAEADGEIRLPARSRFASVALTYHEGWHLPIIYRGRGNIGDDGCTDNDTPCAHWSFR